MATNSFFQVPPDSTGKRVFTQQHTVNALPVQIQGMHLVDGTDPGRIQRVDVRGQASVRFAEGSPSMDAFGNLRIGEATCLGVYDYAHGDSADLFQDLLTAGGSVTHNPLRSDTAFTVNGTNGASVSRTTVRFHHYQPGVSNLVIQTVVNSDSGQAGNRRRWGYFDTNDGLFWELDGTTLYVVMRSSVSGSIVDTKVAQADWNEDALQGTGISGMSLNLTKANFFFIDFAWLGVGEVRFGVLGPGGERNICHVFKNPNLNNTVYMRTGCAPLRWENTNTGVSGGSTLYSICSAVYSQSRIDYTYWRFADIENMTGVVLTDDTPTPVLSMRIRPGEHVGVYPESINALVEGGSVKLTIVDDGDLTGGSWSNAGSVVEKNTTATAIANGTAFYSHWVDAGAHHLELSEYYETNDEGYHRLPDDSGSYIFTLVATKLSGTSVTVKAGLCYRELR